jgi:plastocyanin
MKRAVMRIVVLTCVAAGCLALPALASAKGKTLCCVEHLHFAAGPYSVHSGANAIFVQAGVPKPMVDGYMLRMVPNLHYALPNGKCCGAIPFVDIVHLHHGVWLSSGSLGLGEGNSGYRLGNNTLYPFMATGEEKTIYSLPPGYGYPIKASDLWFFNYMIHDLIPAPAKVYVTYEIDFVPERTPLAKTLTAAHPIWMDVEDGEIYPVFNVLQHSGVNGRFTFPEMAKNPYQSPRPARNLFTVDHSGVLLDTAGHVHPGGLWTQLDDTRAGVRPHGGTLPGVTRGSVRLFRSYANYWDPRGPISWDMAMKGTSLDWRPAVKAGDVLSINATYETRRASWYESMGIMVVWEAWNSQRGIDVFTGKREAHPANPTYGGVDPFTHRLDQVGHVTHGRLKENIDDGGLYVQYKINLNTLPDCTASQVTISHYVYNPGGFQATGRNRCMPTITQGQTVTFVNQDAPDSAQGFLFNPISPYGTAIFHTVSSCQNPCGLNTGISYPLVNGTGHFDSGQLGIGTPATGRLTWTTPKGLKPGIYTYFCRIHPFMRGVFRVVAGSST